MSQQKICLASDNWTPAHPLVIKAITEANQGYAPSYGSDVWTEEAGRYEAKNDHILWLSYLLLRSRTNPPQVARENF